jgi:hypothetical protein
LVTLPVALFGNAAASWVNDANTIGLADSSAQSPSATDPSSLGATGANPHDAKLSPGVLDNAGNPAALASEGPLANLPSGPLGIPGIVLQAYLKAQQELAVSDPSCQLPWWLLAGIGKVESGQAENGEVDTNGNTLRPILGPVLDGSGGFAAIPDTDHGVWDGNTTWDRAVGPMQFLPSTWRHYSNGNPNNVFDAALAAGKYLCAGGGNLSDPAQQAVAVFSYNHSDSYVRLVLIWADAYRNGVTPLPETTVPPVVEAAVNGPVPAGAAAPATNPVGTTTTTTVGGGNGGGGGGGTTSGTPTRTSPASGNGGSGSSTPPSSSCTATSTTTTTSTTPPPSSTTTTTTTPPSSTTTTDPTTTTTAPPTC